MGQIGASSAGLHLVSSAIMGEQEYPCVSSHPVFKESRTCSQVASISGRLKMDMLDNATSAPRPLQDHLLK